MAWQVVMAGVGAAFSIYSGMKADKNSREMVEKKYKLDKKLDQFSWEETLEQYAFNKESIDIATYNMHQEKKWKEKQALDAWSDKEKIRLFDYDNKIQAYNASLKEAGEQLKNVDVAAALATNANKRAYQDKLDAIGFRLESLKLTKDETDAQLGRKRTGVKLQGKEAGLQYKYSHKEVIANLAKQKRNLSEQLEQSDIKSLLAQDKIIAAGQTGRSVERNLASNRAALGRLQNKILYSYMTSEEEAGINLDKLSDNLDLTKEKLEEADAAVIDEYLNIDKQDELGRRELYTSLKSANLQQDYEVEKLKVDKFKQQQQAYGLVKARPVAAPQLSKPQKLPVPKLQKPRPPRRGPKPEKGISSGGTHGLAALGSALTGFSSAYSGYKASL